MNGPDGDELADVVLAIATYRADAAVLATLAPLFEGGESPFAATLVVDSLAGGALGDEFRRRGWTVDYVDADRNLGSAGNLCLRLQLAAEKPVNWCFALNHDGQLDLNAVRALVRSGRAHERVGAVYPVRVRSNRGYGIEAPRTGFLPLSSLKVDVGTSPVGDQEVAWNSSNGTLYGLAPTRAGILVWADLWMGWEDLSYGWQLWSHGWRQIRCARAVFVDQYEHRAVNFLGRGIYIHDKPPWMSYYTIRNLALFVRRSRAGAKGWMVVLWRFAQETLLVLLYKADKLKRLKMLLRGLFDGARGRTGMITSPASVS